MELAGSVLKGIGSLIAHAANSAREIANLPELATEVSDELDVLRSVADDMVARLGGKEPGRELTTRLGHAKRFLEKVDKDFTKLKDVVEKKGHKRFLSYWKSGENIQKWKDHKEKAAQLVQALKGCAQESMRVFSGKPTACIENHKAREFWIDNFSAIVGQVEWQAFVGTYGRRFPESVSTVALQSLPKHLGWGERAVFFLTTTDFNDMVNYLECFPFLQSSIEKITGSSEREAEAKRTVSELTKRYMNAGKEEQPLHHREEPLRRSDLGHNVARRVAMFLNQDQQRFIHLVNGGDVDAVAGVLQSKGVAAVEWIASCTDPGTHLSPLHLAASCGDVAMCKLLLLHGANACEADVGGRTSFHWAILSGDAPTIDALSEFSKSLPKDALIAAIRCGASTEVLSTLVKKMVGSAKEFLSVPGVLSTIATLDDPETLDDVVAVAAEGHVAFPQVSVVDRQRQSTVKAPLVCAVAYQDANEVYCRLIDRYKTDANAVDHDHNSAAHYAVRGDCSEAMLSAIEKSGVPVDGQNVDGETPLHVAVGCDHPDSVRNLLCRDGGNASRKVKDNHGRTPLHVAAAHGARPAVIQDICERPAKIDQSTLDAQDDVGNSVLHQTLKNPGSVDPAVEYLLRCGCNPNIADSCGVSPLHTAVGRDSSHLVNWMLVHDADANAANLSVETPLHWAAGSDEPNPEIITSLLRAGAVPDGLSRKGQTAQHLLGQRIARQILNEKEVSVKDLDCLMLMYDKVKRGSPLPRKLAHQGNPSLPDLSTEMKESILHLLARYAPEYLKEVLELVKDNTAVDIDVPNGEGDTPLHVAAEEGNCDSVKILCDHHADINAKNHKSETPFFRACKAGFLDVAKLLTIFGADVNLVTCDGETALYAAAYYGREEIVRLLLETTNEAARADPNVAVKNDWLPLHAAIDIGAFSVARLLLQHGSDPNRVTHDGLSALHYATQYAGAAAENLVRMLLEMGAKTSAPPKGSWKVSWNPLAFMAARGSCYEPSVDLLAQYSTLETVKECVGESEENACSAVGWCCLRCDENDGLDCLKAILKHHSQAVNEVVDRDGYTALMSAVVMGRKAIVRHLLTLPSIDLSLTDNQGRMALDRVWDREIAQLIAGKMGREVPETLAPAPTFSDQHMSELEAPPVPKTLL